MSLSSALNSAVSGLNAQSAALAIISNNLANTDTVGYKTTDATFSSMVASAAVKGTGGVTVAGTSNISAQGLLTTSSSSTSIAVEGNGFFTVSSTQDGTSVYYTRDGEFTLNTDGYLTNGGYYLLGWTTDAEGNVVGGETAGNLVAIDVDSIGSSASPTTEAALVANLPADAADDSTFTSSMDIYDSLGTAATVTLTWTKSGENEWTVSFSDPVNAAGDAIGEVSSDDITITFNDDGTFADADGLSLTIENWTTGAADSAITLDLGDADTANGLSQYASGSTGSNVNVQVTQDGVATGSLTGVQIDDSGIVSGVYDNGTTRALYKLPVASFTNSNGLDAMSGGIYQSTAESGTASLHASGQGGAGTIHGGQLELSTTDTNQEFANMMAAQQAYSSAAQVVTTVKSMFESLISAVR